MTNTAAVKYKKPQKAKILKELSPHFVFRRLLLVSSLGVKPFF